jgi:hypothetical protein
MIVSSAKPSRGLVLLWRWIGAAYQVMITPRSEWVEDVACVSGDLWVRDVSLGSVAVCELQLIYARQLHPIVWAAATTSVHRSCHIPVLKIGIEISIRVSRMIKSHA